MQTERTTKVGTKMWMIVAASALLVLIPGHSQGQAVFPDANGEALAGVTAVDAYFNTTAWIEVEADEDLFQSNAQSAFELGLRRDGVIVDPSAPNYLFCEIMAAQREEIVLYAYSVQYYTFESSGVHVLTWNAGGLATRGSSLFTDEEVAGDCVDLFANEWLKWNPRR